MERIVKGIWIPIEIWQNTKLSWNEKILLMEVDSFTSKGRECYISNEYIADLLGVSERYASKCLSTLIDEGLVKVVRFDGRKRYIESALQFQAEWNNCSRQDGTFVPHTDNNRLIDNTLSNKAERFAKPSLDAIRDYCRERGNGVDADQFYNFYESNGWKVGRNPMKDWKAAVRTWEKREKEIPQRKSSPVKRESVYEHNLKVIDQMFGTDYHAQEYGKKEDADEQ